MATYSIKDLEKLSGIKAHTIRIWEKRYSLVNPCRTNTNIRYYTDADLRRLMNVSILARNGIKISKIANLGNEEIGEKVLMFNQKFGNTENQIESLVISMIELDENKFDRLLSNLIIKFGFENTFLQVLHPFFERIGLLWQAGTIMPAHEHFISNLVRQKIIVAIDSHRDQPIIKKNQFMLFLPEGEMHELGLLFIQYLLRKRGYKSIYLGQSLPIQDLPDIIEYSKTNYYVTSLTYSLTEKKYNDLINRMNAAFNNQKVFISGAQFTKVPNKLPENYIVIHSPLDFISHLDTID